MAEAYLVDPAGWVELYLSPEEVATLLVVLCKVGGHPVNSPRAGERGITEALGKIGLHFWSGLADKYHDLLGAGGNGIVFKDFPEPEPEFEAGYYLAPTGLGNNPALYFESAEYLAAYAEDEGRTIDDFIRVNIVPAE